MDRAIALIGSTLLMAFASRYLAAQPLPYDKMAARIAAAVKVMPGESVILRLNPDVMPALEPAVRGALERAGAKVETISGAVPDFDKRLGAADVYVWLPGASGVTGESDRKALTKWVDGLGAEASAKAAGSRRELHFHWLEGTLLDNGLPARHTEAYDRLYFDALDIDYVALAARMDRAIALLRTGEARVTTPAGTDIRFRVGERPFNKQDGDGSRERVAKAQMRIDRHIELPAGVLRVAPLEPSVAGKMAIESFPIGDVRARGVVLTFDGGRVVNATAREGIDSVKKLLATPGASEFREFGLGFNPKLLPPQGDSTVPYYGYGDGVVRMSLGDNEELGGNVRGGFVRWIFFTDATVAVNGEVLVQNGRLALK
jgi:Thermophilic metalloprotease (M29)